MTGAPALGEDTVAGPPGRAWLLGAAALVLAGFCLRPPITGLGAALEFVPAATGIDSVVLGWVVTLPLWCYAVGGLLTPRLAAAWDPARVFAGALAIMAVGQLVRVLGGPGLLITGTTVTALATALVATLLPVLAGRSAHGATRMTALYAPAIGIGSAAGAFLTTPVSAAGSWRWGLGLWAPVCAVAVVLWVCALRRDPGPDATGSPAPPLRSILVPRGRLSWSLIVLFAAWATTAFGVMNLLPSFYREAGTDPATAGLLLGIAAAAGLPAAALLPGWVRRADGPGRALPLVVATVTPALGLLGLSRYPQTAPWLWAAAIGVGLGTLSLILSLISLRAPGQGSVTVLSATTHGIGYALAGVGVAAQSALHMWCGSWEPVIWLLAGLCLVQLLAGSAVPQPPRRPDPGGHAVAGGP
ncbi:MFS transporter [Nocardia sienata]|uniref:MFS transporter n=1 Tax=Nocardia sienata TaxID=248552 RepID=UPI0007A43D56|nr:MFS transporter [Nocardia sienata]